MTVPKATGVKGLQTGGRKEKVTKKATVKKKNVQEKPERKNRWTEERDTEYESRVVDEAFVGNWFPPEVNRQARGAFVPDDNAVSFKELQSAISSVPSDNSVMVVPQLTVLPGRQNDKWGWVQTGMGPHYGSVFSMATCRHEKRVLPCVKKLAEAGKLWFAVLASKSMMNSAFAKDFKLRDDPPYWLVSLHKVVYTRPTQFLYKSLLDDIAPDAVQIKRNDHYRNGDLFMPTEEAQEKAKRKNIPGEDIDYWGDLSNYEHCNVTNRHFVQSKHNPNQKERLAKDVKYVRGNRVSDIHIGRPRTHRSWKKEAFAWRDSGIQFYDKRYGRERNKYGCGLQPHGGLVPIDIFRKSLFAGETLEEWAEQRCKV